MEEEKEVKNCSILLCTSAQLFRPHTSCGRVFLKLSSFFEGVAIYQLSFFNQKQIRLAKLFTPFVRRAYDIFYGYLK